MNLKLNYAIAAGVAGLIPGATVILVVLEGVMFFHICHKARVPVLGEGFTFAATMAVLSVILKGMVETLHVVLGLGQVVNAAVAFMVVLGLGQVIENYARHRASSEVR